MRVVYTGLDGLDLAYQGRLPAKVRAELERAKERAKEAGEPVLALIGAKATPVHVYPHGGPGFSFMWETGEDGEVWMATDSDNPEGWGLRVSVKSLALAVHGYAGPGGVRQRLATRLDDLGAQVLAESVSRVDVAIDIHAPGFTIDPSRFVTRCEWHAYEDREQDGGARVAESVDRQLWVGAHREWHGRGGKCNSVRVGSIRKLQVALYDKRLDALKKRKTHWWRIWGLDPADKAARVFRAEIRFGKDLLAYGFNIRNLDDLEVHLSLLARYCFGKVQLKAEGDDDSNVTRRRADPFWHIAAEAAERLAEQWRQVAAPMPVHVTLKRQKIADLKAGMRGVVAGLAAATGAKLDDLPLYLSDLLGYWLREERDELAASVKRQADRLYFIDAALAAEGEAARAAA
jgi:hypothetical protein